MTLHSLPASMPLAVFPDTLLSAFGASYREVAVGKIAWLAQSTPLPLECGAQLACFPLAYQTYGTLNAEKSNAVLVCHGLTGDQYAASTHPVTGKPGWWSAMIGPGKPVDTDRFFVIATNVIGGCMGSVGPKSVNPATGVPYGLGFPVVTVEDMVRAQALLLDVLGVERLACAIGGSMGGMQAMTFAALYPERIFSVIAVASAARHSAQNIAFQEVGRQAIRVDPEWCGGNYYAEKRFPAKGLSVARMATHITYLSDHTLHRKFGRALQDRDAVSFGFEADFQVESYLRHQGEAFVERFDPNSYFYITRAMNYFDLTQGPGLAARFKGTRARFLILSFTSDWLYPTSESRLIVQALNAAAANVSFAEIATDKGHDAFLLPHAEYFALISGFLHDAAPASAR